MISAFAMWREASAANRIISTAPTAKLGAIRAFAGPPSASSRISSTCAAARPVVPIDHVDAGRQGLAHCRRPPGNREVDHHLRAGRGEGLAEVGIGRPGVPGEQRV